MLDFGFYNMDCMDGMKEFPDGYFELAIVDPPYGDASKNKGGGYWNRFGQRFDRYKDPQTRKPPGAGHGVARTGGTWAAKFSKKLYRGM